MTKIDYKNLHQNTKTRHLIVGLVLFSFLLFLTVFSNHGLLTLLQLKLQKSNLENEIIYQKFVRDSLKNEIQLLNSDSLTMEKVAREKYGMVRPGEKIYFINEKKAE